jgi:putative ABC transport system permease protein
MGIPLLRGRSFTRLETVNGATVAVISEATARLCWPGQDPVGKHMSLRLGKDKFYDFAVIGVAKDVHHADLSETDPLHVYLPTDGTKGTFLGGLIIRIRGDRGRALAAVQSALTAVDRSLLPGLQLVQVAEGPLAMQRGFNRVIGIAAGSLTLLALVLASVGIYGVMTFVVSQRTHELGIRMALGATTPAILKNVVTQGLRPVFIGMAAGFVAAVAADAWDRSTDLVPETMLHSVFTNPQIYYEVTLMLAIAILASAIPARRAARVDPMVALRHE